MTTFPKLTRTMFHRLMTDPEYLAAMQHLYGAIAQLRDMDMRHRAPSRTYHAADHEAYQTAQDKRWLKACTGD